MYFHAPDICLDTASIHNLNNVYVFSDVANYSIIYCQKFIFVLCSNLPTKCNEEVIDNKLYFLSAKEKIQSIMNRHTMID